jgi:KDO2-lipid IV(A) lauroyltransferase
MRRMNEKAFSKIVEVEGLEVLNSALSWRKGAIILPAHYGNWEIMANAVGYLKFNAHYVAKRLKNPCLDKMVNNYRCETGNKVIYTNGASKEMEDALKKGGVVAIFLDQKVPLREGGILVKFFGHDAATIPLIAKLHPASFDLFWNYKLFGTLKITCVIARLSKNPFHVPACLCQQYEN